MKSPTQLQREILTDLFLLQKKERKIGRLVFRLRHEARRKIIDDMVEAGYIKEENSYYRLCAVALLDLTIPEVAVLMNTCEDLYKELKNQYRKNFNENVRVSDLAVRAGLSLADALEALDYMKDVSWYCSWSLDSAPIDEMYVGVGERVLDHDLFEDGLKEIREWRKSSPFKQFGLGLSAIPAQADRTDISLRTPDWHKTLDEPLRKILSELYEARASGLLNLAMLGVRTVLDILCSGFSDTDATFTEKLKVGKANGILTDDHCKVLAVAFDAGSAVAHRKHLVTADNLDIAIEVMENAVFTQLRMQSLADAIATITPPRNPKRRKAPEDISLPRG